MKTIPTQKERLFLVIAKRKYATQKKKAVQAYALELLAALHSAAPITDEELRRGSHSWRAYSYGERSLTNIKEIIWRLKGPEEFENYLFSRKKEYRKIKWFDEQASALESASNLLITTARRYK